MFSGAVELKKDVKYLIILRWREGGGEGEDKQVTYIERSGVFWGFESLPILTQLSSVDNGFCCQQVKFDKYVKIKYP